MTTSLAHRFTSKEAAAKVWAEPYGVHGRPGGFLHTRSAAEYAELPAWLQARPHALAGQVQRLINAAGNGRSLHGWHDLGLLLLTRGLLTADVGPRGGVRHYTLGSSDRAL